ncbi:MAG: rubredoxin [Eubacterium sp.]|nr:rubredoxin [Eubacterium sp.]
MDIYVCGACGWEYDPAKGDPENGIPAGTPFEDLPDTYECPICMMRKAVFEKKKD